MESHQSNQEVTSHTPESMVCKDETWEANKETDRFLTSLAFSRLIEVTPGGTEYGPGKRKRRYGSTDDAFDRAQEGTHARSGPPKF